MEKKLKDVTKLLTDNGFFIRKTKAGVITRTRPESPVPNHTARYDWSQRRVFQEMLIDDIPAITETLETVVFIFSEIGKTNGIEAERLINETLNLKALSVQPNSVDLEISVKGLEKNGILRKFATPTTDHYWGKRKAEKNHVYEKE